MLSKHVSVSLALAAVVALGGLASFGCSSDEGDGDGSAQTGGNSSGGTSGSSSGGSSNGGSSNGGSSNGGSAAGGTAGGGGALAYRPCALDERVGSFTIDLGDGFTAVKGAVKNSVVPSEVPELVGEEGVCRLYRTPNLFCDPPCSAGTTCGDAMACIPAPSNQSVGTVTVSGLAIPLEMMPSMVNAYANPATPALPHPGFTEGAAITLEAAGGAYSPFELRGRGISALALENDEFVVAEGEPLSVSWAPPADSEGQVVRFTLEFNRHGGTPTWLECDAPDTGSFDIPASLLDELLSVEVSGWPTLSAARRTVDSTEISAGCVELRVVSAVTVDVELPGVTSCDSENPCPAPQMCQANLLCE
jgi:hypothetical protein